MNEAMILEQVVANGNLAALNPEQRVQWYRMRCEAAGLDYRTQPFQYITLQGKLTLYATKTATEQLCLVRGISTQIVTRERADDLAIVVCRAVDRAGRYTDSMGAVSVAGLKGDALANALMKAETKAKRRAVLSLSGLGMLDETETETIPGAVVEPLALPPAQPEPPTEPEPRPTPTPADKIVTTGEPPKVKVPPVTFEDPLAFKAAADDLARRVPHYQAANGATNKPHIMNALALLGYTRITADNVAEAIAKLEQHARERADAQAATE